MKHNFISSLQILLREKYVKLIRAVVEFDAIVVLICGKGTTQSVCVMSQTCINWSCITNEKVNK